MKSDSTPLPVKERLPALIHVLRRVFATGIRWLTQQEAVVLVALLVIVVAFFGFVKIAEELGESELTGVDEWLLQLLRVPGQPHVPIGPAWLLEAAQDITVLGGRTMLVSVAVFTIGYLALERKYGAMWLVTAAAAGGGVLDSVLKHLFDRGRPSVVPHLVAVTSPSFPSGHSMLGAIIYLTLGALLARFATRRRTKIYLLAVAVVITVVIGATRVYLGVLARRPLSPVSGGRRQNRTRVVPVHLGPPISRIERLRGSPPSAYATREALSRRMGYDPGTREG